MCGEREAEEDGDGVEVGHEVVGDPAGLHVGGLGDCVAGELVLAEPVDDEWDAIVGSQHTLTSISGMVMIKDDRLLTQCALRPTPFASPR